MDCQYSKQKDLSLRLLMCCRNELYSIFPYLDGAFASLRPVPDQHTATICTDGNQILFSPDYLIRLYSSRPVMLRRGLLHLMLHCLFGHPFGRRDNPPDLWDLACDMAVEQMIELEGQPRLDLPVDPVRQRCMALLGKPARSADAICRLLEQGFFPFAFGKMAAAFMADDHKVWSCMARGSQEKWENLLAYTQNGRAKQGTGRGMTPGSRWEDLEPITPGIRDYRAFLRQFAVFKEETELDMDSFDPIYYCLGLERYGNIPLIEPPETREGRKLEDLVIAIDTSGSCSREAVQGFLRETYQILSRQENFFRKMNVHLVQCDCMIQATAVIHSEREWKNYSREIRIVGRGGTDFTPVFRYVREQRCQGKLRNLKALLYFTDGDGFYPREKPDYQVAFVFLEAGKHMDAVPKWASVLLINDR